MGHTASSTALACNAPPTACVRTSTRRTRPDTIDARPRTLNHSIPKPTTQSTATANTWTDT